jgi:ADP-ribose diphosphatase
MGFTINVVLATDLYPASLPADEPEPPEVVTWPLADLDSLINSDEFREARAIAALCLARPLLSG